ncbi:MAG: dTMP kinase [Acidimicrobiales bacterium]
MTGRLIAFEGGEGLGKSTQAALLAARLSAVLTREPGGTSLGEQLRAVVIDRATVALDDRAEALLMAAARAQHVAEVIAPALAAGRDVVVDRFSHSSLAYQGAGRGLAVDDLRWLSDWATGGCWPDVVVLLDLEPGASLTVPDAGDRFESEDLAFHRRVVECFHAMAAADPQHWRVVDGRGPVEAVAARVWAAVQP